MYVCPDCKSPLVQLRCPSCAVQFQAAGGIPELLSRDAKFANAGSIGSTYDDIYTRRTKVWEDQGRTPEFLRFFSDLVGDVGGGRLLEVGCGEGFLLASLRAGEKCAVDISATALAKTRDRTQAQCSVALAERLPFADKSFDVVVSVGVMEHFLDDAAASREIHRVLKSGGRYVVLIHVHADAGAKIRQKLREYVFPRPRPLAFLAWVGKKLYRPIHQPVQNDYTVASARACLERAGLDVVRVIQQKTDPTAPLVGPHVVIYLTHKR